jgi:cytochrome c
MLRIWVLAGIAFAASTGPSVGQDAAAGEQVFRRLCSPCHEIGPEAKIKLGPPLNGIDGRKSGTFDGFNYSPANKSSGITWSEETFPKYIRAPMQEMPGTRMAFVGIKNEKTLQMFGPTSSNSGPKARRNKIAEAWRGWRVATALPHPRRCDEVGPQRMPNLKRPHVCHNGHIAKCSNSVCQNITRP